MVVIWGLPGHKCRPSSMDDTRSSFESKLRYQGCDPRTVTLKSFEVGEELGLATKMAHGVRWEHGLRTELDPRFSFFLNYDCTDDDDKLNLVVAFGQGLWFVKIT